MSDVDKSKWNEIMRSTAQVNIKEKKLAVKSIYDQIVSRNGEALKKLSKN